MSIEAEYDGTLATLTLNREEKRNALNDETVLGIETFFRSLPEQTRVVVIAAKGKHFCAGLDLASLDATDAFGGLRHSQMWHRVFNLIEFGPVPVIAALQGAVIGGGLELAAAAHIRVADTSAFYALPEGTRGLFVGGGASVRLPRLVGAHRVADMMLTGRVLTAAEGLQFGITQYVTNEGAALAKALELAEKIAANSPISNFAVVQALPRIAEADPQQGSLMESLMAAIASSSDEAQARMRAFIAGTGPKVQQQTTGDITK